MEKRNLQISYEQAENWYNGTNEELKQLALETFPELGKKELPKTWEELRKISGFYVDSESGVYKCSELDTVYQENRNLYATKEMAEASIALAQLSQLREVYRNGWVPDDSVKYTIVFTDNGIREYSYITINNFLSFQDKETRDLFLKNFKDLIEKAKPLMS